MQKMLRILAAIAVLAVASPAVAQEDPLTFHGFTFDAREGWCPQQVAANDLLTLEIRNCSIANRYMSIALIRPATPGQTYDVAGMAKSASDLLEGAEGKGVIEQVIGVSYGACTVSSMTIERNAVPGTPGFAFAASATCTKDGATSVIDFRNFSAYVVTTGGSLWSVTFDYPDAPLTPDDQAMIKRMADRISGKL